MRRASDAMRADEGPLVRWEKGTVFQNKATDSLLRLIDRFREAAGFLGGLHGVEVDRGEAACLPGH